MTAVEYVSSRTESGAASIDATPDVFSSPTSAPPTLDPVASKLATLGLDYPASCLPDLLEQCTREQLSPLSFLELVLTGELERKDERRVTTMLKLSGLPSGKTLEDFDWSFQPRVDRCGFRSSWSRVSREADQVVRSKLITRLGGR